MINLFIIYNIRKVGKYIDINCKLNIKVINKKFNIKKSFFYLNY